MANIIDYVKWRGDLPFAVSPACELDAALFSQLSYWNMDDIVPTDLAENMTIRDLCESHVLEKLPPYCSESDLILKELLKKSDRFSGVLVSKYVNEIDPEKETQFSAVTFTISRRMHYIVFRGTDNTLTGWKECMNLSFDEEIEGQRKAVAYLQETAQRTRGDLYVTGHSKGGNLAVYASAFSAETLNDRIRAIYNFDGPGFNDKVIEKDRFQRVRFRTHTFVPQDSLVGMLLTHKEPYQVIYSTASNGMSQHDLYTWECNAKHFVYADKLTSSGENTYEIIREWLDALSFEEKRQFVEVVYDLVDEYHTVGKLFTFKSFYKVMQEYRGLDDEKKKIVSDTVAALRRSVFGEVKDTYQEVREKVTEKVNDKLPWKSK
ncbi:MAG: DUF2974 domain-containing protein [Lachnospiraceae bacterium]|nr:DUF2974 domain-containing protein [Lachnospiraceae bacterium]